MIATVDDSMSCSANRQRRGATVGKAGVYGYRTLACYVPGWTRHTLLSYGDQGERLLE